MKSNLVCTETMNSGNTRQEYEEMLQDYFQELVMELNFRMLAETDANDCICEPLLMVENITVTDVVYPDIPHKDSFWKRVIRRIRKLWKWITFR